MESILLACSAKRKKTLYCPSCVKAAEELGTYPIIHKLLRSFVTLPVTMASNERCFSSLKYLNNYLRSIKYDGTAFGRSSAVAPQQRHFTQL